MTKLNDVRSSSEGGMNAKSENLFLADDSEISCVRFALCGFVLRVLQGKRESAALDQLRIVSNV